jgi:hypothetical protein
VPRVTTGLEESSALPQRDVIAAYKACERKGGKRLLVFGLLGTLIDYSHFVSLEHLLPSVRRNLAEIAASPQVRTLARRAALVSKSAQLLHPRPTPTTPTRPTFPTTHPIAHAHPR